MKALSIHSKKLMGVFVATAALAVLAAPSALATSGQIAPDHWAANDQFASLASDPSLLRDRSTDLGRIDRESPATVGASDPSLLRDRSTDRGTFVPQSDPSLLRDRSTDLGGTANESRVSAAPAPVAEPVSGDGFQWGDAGIFAGSVFGLMLLGLLAAVVVRRGRQQPKGA